MAEQIFLGALYIEHGRFGGFNFLQSSSESITATKSSFDAPVKLLASRVQTQLIKSFSNFSHVSVSILLICYSRQSALSFRNWFLVFSRSPLLPIRQIVHFSLVINMHSVHSCKRLMMMTPQHVHRVYYLTWRRCSHVIVIHSFELTAFTCAHDRSTYNATVHRCDGLISTAL